MTKNYTLLFLTQVRRFLNLSQIYETLLMLNYVKEGNHLKIRAKEKQVKDGEKDGKL